MEQFKDKVSFQGSTQNSGFNPIRVPDEASLLRQRTDAMAADLNRANEIYNRNMAIESKDSFLNIEGLATFSKTLTDVLAAESERRNEASMQNGLQKAYLDGLSSEEVLTHQAGEDILRATNEQINSLADQAYKGGASFMGVQRIRQLSGWEQYGYAMGMAQQAGMGYAGAMQEALARVPDSASAAEKSAILATARGEYMSKMMLTQLNPALVNKYAFPAMKEADGRFITSFREADIKRIQLEQRELTLNTFNAGNQAELFNDSILALERSGLTKGDARQTLIENITDVGVLDEVANNVSWNGKNKNIEIYRAEFIKRRRELISGELQDYRAEEEADENAFQQAEDLALAELGNPDSPATNEQIDQANEEFARRYGGRRSSKLEALKQNYTIDAIQAKEINAELERRASLGILTAEDLKHLPYDLQAKWSKVAEQQAGVSKVESKQQLDAIEGAVLSLPAFKADPLASRNPVATLIVGSLQSEFRRKVALYTQQGMDPTTAVQQAGAEVVTYFNESQNSPNQRFYYDPQKRQFTNYMKSGNFAPGARATFDRIKNIKDMLSSTGYESAINSPGLFLTEKEAREFDNKVVQVPPLVRYYAEKYNRNPLEIINAQRKAWKMPPVKSPALEATGGITDSRLRALFNTFPSPNRASRGGQGFSSFQPALVPNGLGKVIASAAKANGLDPALLAGLLDHESMGFNPDVIAGRRLSSAGAVGVAQIMPQYHPGVNPKDPIASIQYAAKYLNQLRQQFGSLNLAIYAYNAGPNAVRQYGGPIPGDAESQGYLKNVLKSSAKYGYGQAWGDPATMRGRFRNAGIQVTSAIDATGEPGSDFVVSGGKRGSPFSFPFPAKVVKVVSGQDGATSGYGNYVDLRVKLPNGRTSDVRLAHFDQLNPGLRVGASVAANTFIGTQGRTGRTTGAHVSADWYLPGSNTPDTHSRDWFLNNYLKKNSG